MNDALAAAALLTILPIRRELAYSARALAWFPLVGAALGVSLFTAALLLQNLLPPTLSAGLLVALWALLSGALHLDGTGDACDALMAAAPPERRLEILRDVHLGVFGVTAIVLVLLLKFAALTAVPVTFLLLAPVLARWAMVYTAAFPRARREGMAELFTRGLTRREIFIATFLTFVWVAPFGWRGVIAWVGAVICATLLARLAMARLGGLTGDIYGLICETVEVTVLALAAAR